MRRALTLLLTLSSLGLALAAQASAQTPVDPRGVAATHPNPLEGLTFFNDTESPAYESWRWLSNSGQQAKADLVWKIAGQPRAIWLGRWTRPNFAVKINRLIHAAKAAGTVPVFTVLRAEGQKCSPTYQGGGPAGDRATRAWYDDLARVLGNERVVIAFEPDSLGTIDCLARSRRDDRIRLLRYGVDQLSQLPNATVYLEAGASDWENAKRTANQLRAIGVAKVRGFMLNATHSDWTRENIKHGLEISRLTGGKHFIINTAENGRGPVHYALPNGKRGTQWCNPGLRGLGPAPTTDTSHPKVDAYLWINRPGYAQICQGRPIAWYLPRSLEYARYATDWESAPPGTRYGHAKRYPLSKFRIRR